MATWTRTSGEGSFASSTTRSRTFLATARLIREDPDVARRPDAPGSEGRVLVIHREPARVEVAQADQGPEGMQPGFPRGPFVFPERVELGSGRALGRGVSLAEEALGGLAEVDVGAGEPPDELVVRLPGEVEASTLEGVSW